MVRPVFQSWLNPRNSIVSKVGKVARQRVISLLNEAVQAQNGRASAFRLSGLDATRLKGKCSAMDRFHRCPPVMASEV